jgi:predicted lipid carrier protein YhbT
MVNSAPFQRDSEIETAPVTDLARVHPHRMTAPAAVDPSLGSMSGATAAFFGELAERGHEPLLENTQGTLRVELADGKQVDRWFLEVDNGDLAVSRKNAKADCTVRAKKELFDGIAGGKVNATAAVLRGALTIDGDVELMVRLQRLFPGPRVRRTRRSRSEAGRRKA